MYLHNITKIRIEVQLKIEFRVFEYNYVLY